MRALINYKVNYFNAETGLGGVIDRNTRLSININIYVYNNIINRIVGGWLIHKL